MKTLSTLNAAETLLHDLLARYGKPGCDTPHMFETLLRKHGRACPQEVDLLVSALRCGVVRDLRGTTPPAPEKLARVLAVSGRVPAEQAQWAVATWSTALAAAPDVVARPGKSDPLAGGRSGPYSPARAAIVLAAAAATGAIAYLTFGP